MDSLLFQSCTCSGADFTDLAEIVSRIEPVQGYVTEGEGEFQVQPSFTQRVERC